MDETTRGSHGRRGMRAWATALALMSVTGGLVVASPADAAKPGVPTLEGVSLSGPPSYSNVLCNPDGTSSFDYQVSGTASGSYAGTFTEHGHVTIGQQNTRQFFGGQSYEVTWTTGYVADLQATFTITSSTGAVSGTRTLIETRLGACQTSVRYSVFGFEGSAPAFMVVADGVFAYRATITTGRRAYCDRGTSFTRNGGAAIGSPIDVTLLATGYSTAFSSDLGSSEPRRGQHVC